MGYVARTILITMIYGKENSWTNKTNRFVNLVGCSNHVVHNYIMWISGIINVGFSHKLIFLARFLQVLLLLFNVLLIFPKMQGGCK
jgi:hypothetical protein